MNYYILGILPVFEGGSLKISDQYSFEALPIPSQTEWEHRLNTLLKNGAVLIDKIEKLADKELVAIFVDKK